MKVINNTAYSLEGIETLPVLGTTINNWRQRTVTLYAHPLYEDRLISSGVTFDKSMRVLDDEPRVQWARALEYAAMGKVYVSA